MSRSKFLVFVTVSETTNGCMGNTSNDSLYTNDRSVENALALKLELVDSSTQTSDYDVGKQKVSCILYFLVPKCWGGVRIRWGWNFQENPVSLELEL